MPVPTNPCRTVRCSREATNKIKVTYSDGAVHTDEVCRPCARYYRTFSGTSLLDGAIITEAEVKV